MSIQSEILRIKNNVDAAYDAVEALGGTLPQDQTVANLLAAIASIKGISTIQPSIYQGDISKQIARIAADIASAYRLCEDSGATMPSSLVVGNLATCISTIPTDWSWGSEDGEADEAWFAGLAEYLSYSQPSGNWVGKEKSVTLSSAVLGTTTHKIVCIGVNQDGDRTVTFQTLNCLANETAFGSDTTGSRTLWSGSIARAKCQEYYNAFPGKAYIKTVAKLTSISYDRPSLESTQETVWIPSHVEMGFAGSNNNRGEWTQGGSGAAYSYYADNAKRVKKTGDSGSANPYWDRSRDHNDSRYVCYVCFDGDESHVVYWGVRYLAPAFVIGPPPFEWGSESGVATSAWFAGLYNFLRHNPGDESWVGKTKNVTLSSPVLGTTTHKIVCIGVNQDADNTVTFQTLNSLTEPSQFSSLREYPSYYARGANYYDRANKIYDGNASGVCKAYYDAFPGKRYIKQLNKGTCVTQTSDRNGTATYQNQYVWIPSEGEVGLDRFSSLGYSNWTTTNGECTYGKKFQYSYYTDNSKRIKKAGDSGSTYYWWTRGRYWYYTDHLCDVGRDGKAASNGYIGSSGVAPAFCIGSDSFDWGDENAEADAGWFAGLKAYLAKNPGEDSWVGKEKTVTLTSEVLGTTTHKIRCIGVNQDADNTVTFQTSNCLATTSKFSSLSSDSSNYDNATNYHHSANLIYDGNASGVCKLYYDAFPGKASIKQLNKGTCTAEVSERNGTATYQNQYVWIPSEGEVGLDSRASLGYSNWTTTNGECTYGKKFQYSYYSSNERRVKKTGDSGTYANLWWLRGHYYGNASSVCLVIAGGSASSVGFWVSYGVAPAFCIGN